MKEIYSEFLNEYYFYDVELKKGQWIQELIYYKGDHSTADFVNDWRYKEVPNRRKQVKFISLKEMEFKAIEINWLAEPL